MIRVLAQRRVELIAIGDMANVGREPGVLERLVNPLCIPWIVFQMKQPHWPGRRWIATACGLHRRSNVTDLFRSFFRSLFRSFFYSFFYSFCGVHRESCRAEHRGEAPDTCTLNRLARNRQCSMYLFGLGGCLMRFF